MSWNKTNSKVLEEKVARLKNANHELREQLKAKDERITDLEEVMKPKTCDGCKWEQETKLIRTKVGDRVDICTLCTRYENLQDNYEKKDNK